MKNGYTIFDAHAHVFPNKIAERATSSISVFYDDMPMQHIGSMEQLLKSGANAGIDGYLICSTAPMLHRFRQSINFCGIAAKTMSIASHSLPCTHLLPTVKLTWILFCSMASVELSCIRIFRSFILMIRQFIRYMKSFRKHNCRF